MILKQIGTFSKDRLAYPYCINCIYKEKKSTLYCEHPESKTYKINLVTGERQEYSNTCTLARESGKPCGPKGKLFINFSRIKETQHTIDFGETIYG